MKSEVKGPETINLQKENRAETNTSKFLALKKKKISIKEI